MLYLTNLTRSLAASDSQDEDQGLSGASLDHVHATKENHSLAVAVPSHTHSAESKTPSKIRMSTAIVLSALSLQQQRGGERRCGDSLRPHQYSQAVSG